MMDTYQVQKPDTGVEDIEAADSVVLIADKLQEINIAEAKNCTFCGLEFKYRGGLANHLVKYHDVKENQIFLLCTCLKKFMKSKQFTRHTAVCAIPGEESLF